ncbi:hypothetical protein [Cellulomonas sp. URHD0024]|uniref:hypothetical protein n=1 Tax=Cellulomonas sp. URHD0024 TaxID=1302620 RepID=UPI00041459DB|nr:hypothetical protein [Cellulomonas sp. URHD0024]
MPEHATGPARLVRAFVVALSSVALALGAHVLGGGAVPPAVVVVPLVAVVLAAGVPFGGRRIGAPAAVALLGVGQLGLHHAFGALSGMGCVPAQEMTGHVHTVQVACAAVPPQLPGAGGSAMLWVHVVATLVTALLIAGTERALAWVGTWLRPLIALLAPVPLPTLACLPVMVEMPHAVGRRDAGVVPLRGPPVCPAHVTLAA